MSLIDAIAGGLAQSLSWAVLPYLVAGSVFGLVVGVIPGLSGYFAMAMAVTFLYSMEQAAGLAFIIAAHATVAQGGGLTSILFSVPGTGQNVATLIEGPKMRQNGEAGLAVGAAMTSCFLGATFGAVVLAALIPLLREVVLVFGPPEIFVLAVMGLVFIAVLGERDLVRSLIAGLLGLFLALVGVDGATNLDRFTLGSDYLADGLSLVPVVLGIFAVAEMIDLWTKGGTLSGESARVPDRAETRRQILRGVLTAVRRWGLVLRCSTIGVVMGLIPGLGSAPASFVAYAHARQTSDEPERFGTGHVDGVIGPESANDAVEGGALASTIAFGVPGSSSMAILLSAFAVLGLETGPPMLTANLDLVFLMIFTIVLANLIGTLGGMVLLAPLVRVTEIRSTLLVPAILAIIVTGAFAGDRILADIAVAVVFGVIGYVLRALRYSRAALLIGFVLGEPLEYNGHLAIQLDGPFFVFEPLALALAAVTVVFLAHSVRQILRGRDAAGWIDRAEAMRGGTPVPELACLAGIGIAALLAAVETVAVEPRRSAFPLIVLVPLLALAGLQAVRLWRGPRGTAGGWDVDRGAVGTVAMLALYLALILGVGHYAASFAFVFLMIRGLGRERARLALAIAAAMTVAIFLVFEIGFDLEMYRGLVFRFFAGYRDF